MESLFPAMPQTAGNAIAQKGTDPIQKLFLKPYEGSGVANAFGRLPVRAPIEQTTITLVALLRCP